MEKKYGVLRGGAIEPDDAMEALESAVNEWLALGDVECIGGISVVYDKGYCLAYQAVLYGPSVGEKL